MSVGPTMARVLDALDTHGTNPAAAGALGMTLPTVQTHVRRAYELFGVTPGTPGNHAPARAALLAKWRAYRASVV